VRASPSRTEDEVKLGASTRIRSDMERDRDKSEIWFEPLQVQAVRLIGRGVAMLAMWLLRRASGPNPRG
jgi:hypothetical protein